MIEADKKDGMVYMIANEYRVPAIPIIGNNIPNNHEHNAEPKPNINIEIAERIPLCCELGNQRIIFLFGVI